MRTLIVALVAATMATPAQDADQVLADLMAIHQRLTAIEQTAEKARSEADWDQVGHLLGSVIPAEIAGARRAWASLARELRDGTLSPTDPGPTDPPKPPTTGSGIRVRPRGEMAGRSGGPIEPSDDPDDDDPPDPPDDEPELTHLVTPTGFWAYNGPGTADDVFTPEARYPLVEALKASRSAGRAVLGVTGRIPGNDMQFGGGDAGNKAYRADWGGTPMRVEIVGLDANRAAQIRSFEMWDADNQGRPTGGVAELTVRNLTIKSSSSRCIGSPIGARFGKAIFIDVDLRGNTDGSFDGHGMKWGVRARGRGQWHFERVHCAYVQEHVFYIDSPGDSSNPTSNAPAAFFVDCTMDGSWRTMIQIVNRSVDNPGPSGHGLILMQRCHAFNVHGEGGGAFTVAGHLGPVRILDCTATAGYAEDGNPDRKAHGAMALWVDDSPGHGAHLDADGYGIGDVYIRNLRIDYPNSDRSHVQIRGARSLVMDGFEIRGNRRAIDFTQLAWPIGDVCFATGDVPVSQYAGWQGALGKVHWAQGSELSDMELDALACD